MGRKHFYLALGTLVSLVVAAPGWADFNDFFDNAKMKSDFEGCIKANRDCAFRCQRIDESRTGEHKKCEKTCQTEYQSCGARIVDRSMHYDKLPKDAQKIVDKLHKQLDNRYQSCAKKAQSCYGKCAKKAVSVAKLKAKAMIKEKVKDRKESELWDAQMDKTAARRLGVKQFDKKELKARSKAYSEKQLAKLDKFYSEAYDEEYDDCVEEKCDAAHQACVDKANVAFLKELNKGKRKELDKATAGKKP